MRAGTSCPGPRRRSWQLPEGRFVAGALLQAWASEEIGHVVASTTPVEPRLVDPQIVVIWHAPPKLLRAEASVAAQFAAKVRLVRIASFGRDACPVHTRLRGVRSQQQSAFRSCKPRQRPRGPTGHSAHLSFKLASAPPFGKY